MQYFKQMRYQRYIRLILIGLFFVCYTFSNAQTTETARKKILFICSYSSETKYLSEHITNFNNYIKQMGGNGNIVIENVNAASFHEAPSWKEKVKSIFDKHTDADLIILLGGEVWSSYVSLTDAKYHLKPVMASMSNIYGIRLPTTRDSISQFHPVSINLLDQIKHFPNVKCAIAYKYDLDKDIELIREFYPDVQNIAFISDNTYNGVAQKSYIKKECYKYKNLSFIFIDGEKMNMEEAANIYKKLPTHTAALLGAWRIDKENNFYINNSDFIFRQANNDIPVFSLTGSSINNWAIGGYIPRYEDIGKILGEKAFQLLYNNDEERKAEFIIMPNHYQFNVQKLNELGFSDIKLPKHAELINREPTFFESYRYEVGVTIAICISLFIGLLVSLYFYFSTRALGNRLRISSNILQMEKERLEASEIELRAAKERAEEANQMKSAFISNISHEVRTPLNAIVGFSSLLVGTVNVTEEQKEYTEIIETNANLLLQLINDLLDISQIESGKMQFKYEWCEVIGHCRNILRLSNHKQGIKFIFEPFTKEYRLYTDPLRLQQVITNLLNNALKFTPEEGSITLGITKDDLNNRLLFTVTDTGCGIPEHLHDKVFERFIKLNEFKQGTGLGLPICKLILHHMDGEIWIDKDYSNGTKFTFYLPIISI